MIDAEDNNSIDITTFDEECIKVMEINEKVRGECGMWTAFRYSDEYIVAFHHQKNNSMVKLPNPNGVINYIKKFVKREF
ncbi:MAG: hypothetical protein AABY22_25365 [Nanoarchaeota archaeon]